MWRRSVDALRLAFTCGPPNNCTLSNTITPIYSHIAPRLPVTTNLTIGWPAILRHRAGRSATRRRASSHGPFRDRAGSQSFVAGQFDAMVCHPHWAGAGVLSIAPLTVRTSSDPWGYALELPLPDNFPNGHQEGGQYWALLEVQTIDGSAGIGRLSSEGQN